MELINKDHPSSAWIASLRERFTVEREIDRVLTKKMQRRGGPAYSPVSLETLIKGVNSLINSRIKEPFEISNARWLSGGASKLQMAFTLSWQKPNVGRELTEMVLRVEPAESIVETSRLREAELLGAFIGILPVPPVYWVDAYAEHLPYPGLVYGFLEGVTKPTAAGGSGVSGLGMRFPRELGKLLAPQFIDHLGKIHTREFRNIRLPSFDIPQTGSQSAEWTVNMWDRIWEEDSDEDIPLMRLASAWLHKNAPPCDQLSLLHGDYRSGNFMFTENDARISCWLDWELGRIGDRHFDLAWASLAIFGSNDEDGTFLVGGMLPEKEFLEAYEKSSGLKVIPKNLHYYKVLSTYSLVVIFIATAYRVPRNDKCHQDLLLAWLVGAGYLVLDQLRELMDKGD